MKVWPIFSFVIFLHLALIGLLLFQPGCQTGASAPAPEQTRAPAVVPRSTPPSAPVQSPRGLDPAFNAGLAATAAPAAGGRTLSAPRRPDPSPLREPDTGLLQPVLEPASDPFRLDQPGSSYEVVSGDTLSAIARKTGTDLSSLLAANGLTRQSTIYVGQTLSIPAWGTAESAAPLAGPADAGPGPVGGREIVVRAGDTLSGIAARQGTTVSILKRLNNLSSDTIFVGQTLLAPDSGEAVPLALPESSSPVPAPTPSGAGRYTVKAGDTPSGIARSFGISVASLMQANGITDARRMSIGRELVIPAPGGSGMGSGAPVPAPTPSREPSLPEIRRAPSPAPTQPALVQPVDPLDTLESLDGDIPYTDVEEVMVEDPGTGN